MQAKTNSRIIGALTNRLRDTLFVMHQAVFFIGNAYFNMGNKEEQENAAYAEADALRKQVRPRTLGLNRPENADCAVIASAL